MARASDADEWSLDEVEQVASPKASPKAKIQRVPAFLGRIPDFNKYCKPTIISFGPIHHRDEDLKVGQQFKIQWTSQYIEEYREKNNISASEAEHSLYKVIEDDIGELKKLFSEDVIEAYDDKELARMLFADGCSLLYYMDKVNIKHPEALKLKIDQLIHIGRDIILLENQLPMRLLELLTEIQGADLGHLLARLFGKPDGKATNEPKVKPKPTHILDHIRSILVHTENGKNVRNQDEGFHDLGIFWQIYKNIRDVKTAGIRVKPNTTDKMKWDNVSFTSRWFGGELRLPMTVINKGSTVSFRNLIAYEMCPDFHNKFECCSYLSFMDSLIDDAEDVKELRLAGVIQNLLGSDEDVAKLFNELGGYVPTQEFNYFSSDTVAYSKRYAEVKHQIGNHYEKDWNKWLADARSTYFNTPWSLLAFLAALLALVLTFIQTWYAIHPNNNK